MPVLATFTHAVNHLLVPKGTPCRAQESVIYGQNGFLPPWDPIPAGPLPASFRRTKVLPPQRPSRAAPHSAAPQPQLPSLTMASFTATSALVKRDTAPATEKLQFTKSGIRRKRRRMHKGEGKKKKNCFTLKPPQHTEKDPCPSAGPGESGLSLGLCSYQGAGTAGKEGTRLCPPLSKIIKDYACRLWERGCPAGAQRRGSKMRRRSNTT